MEKKTLALYIVNGVLVAAVIALFVLFFTQKQPAPVASTANGNNIAFVRMDSLLLNYNLYNQMSEELLRHEESARADLNQKAAALQKDMEDFQKKLENGAFLTEQRARQEQERILGEQQKLQQLGAKMEQELLLKQKQMNERLSQTIDSVIKVYNEEAGYQFIISTAGNDNLLYGAPAFNVTKDVLKLLNK